MISNDEVILEPRVLTIYDTNVESDISSCLHDKFYTKRDNYIEWQEYYMAIAVLAKQRSKDPRCQVGACIVDKDKKIISVGYNGMPTGCSDDTFPWDNENKHLFVCHAEMNAIMNKNSADTKDCSMYVTRFPCNECAKMIIQSGIKEVIYLSDKKNYKKECQASIKMFDAVGIKYQKYLPKRQIIELSFDDNL